MARAFHGITELGKASKHRWQDAQALFEKNRWRGAMYLAGYAVECLLKVKLMSMFGCRNLQKLEEEMVRRSLIGEQASLYTHHLEVLLKLTQAMDRLRKNGHIWKEFGWVNRWIPAWRYSADPSSRQQAQEFLKAVAIVLEWIENNI